jgi:large-conductance mechanosensitive channel
LFILSTRWYWGWSSKRKAVFKIGKFLLFLVLFFTVAVNVFFIVETTKRLNFEETSSRSENFTNIL